MDLLKLLNKAACLFFEKGVPAGEVTLLNKASQDEAFKTIRFKSFPAIHNGWT